MPRRELGIKVGEFWAYRPGTIGTLTRARIVDPGTHYDARISAVLVDEPGQPYVSGRRAKYPCRWDDLPAYLERKGGSAVLPAEGEDERRVATVAETNAAVAQLPTVVLASVESAPLAYTVKTAAAATGLSGNFVRALIRDGDIPVHYAGRRMLILAGDLRAWVEELPTVREFATPPAQ